MRFFGLSIAVAIIIGFMPAMSNAADPEISVNIFASKQNGLGWSINRDSKAMDHKWTFGFLYRRNATTVYAMPVEVRPAQIAVPVTPAVRPFESAPPPKAVVPVIEVPCKQPTPQETLFATLRR